MPKGFKRTGKPKGTPATMVKCDPVDMQAPKNRANDATTFWFKLAGIKAHRPFSSIYSACFVFAKQRWNFKVYPAGKTSESSDSDCDDDDDINNNGDFCLYLELFENPKRKTSKPMVNLKVSIPEWSVPSASSTAVGATAAATATAVSPFLIHSDLNFSRENSWGWHVMKLKQLPRYYLPGEDAIIIRVDLELLSMPTKKAAPAPKPSSETKIDHDQDDNDEEDEEQDDGGSSEMDKVVVQEQRETEVLATEDSLEPKVSATADDHEHARPEAKVSAPADQQEADGDLPDPEHARPEAKVSAPADRQQADDGMSDPEHERQDQEVLAAVRLVEALVAAQDQEADGKNIKVAMEDQQAEGPLSDQQDHKERVKADQIADLQQQHEATKANFECEMKKLRSEVQIMHQQRQQDAAAWEKRWLQSQQDLFQQAKNREQELLQQMRNQDSARLKELESFKAQTQRDSARLKEQAESFKAQAQRASEQQIKLAALDQRLNNATKLVTSLRQQLKTAQDAHAEAMQMAQASRALQKSAETDADEQKREVKRLTAVIQGLRESSLKQFEDMKAERAVLTRNLDLLKGVGLSALSATELQGVDEQATCLKRLLAKEKLDRAVKEALQQSMHLTAAAAAVETKREIKQEQPPPCVVCHDANRDCVLNCGHPVVCTECAAKLSTCPVCRAVIKTRLKFYA